MTPDCNVVLTDQGVHQSSAAGGGRGGRRPPRQGHRPFHPALMEQLFAVTQRGTASPDPACREAR